MNNPYFIFNKKPVYLLKYRKRMPTLSDKIAAAYDQATRINPNTGRPFQPSAVVYVWKPKPPTGKSREGMWLPFGTDPDGLPKIKIGGGKMKAQMAARGFFPAAKPAAKPAEVKDAETTTRTRKKKEEDEI